MILHSPAISLGYVESIKNMSIIIRLVSTLLGKEVFEKMSLSFELFCDVPILWSFYNLV